ncbi:MAG: VPEID-CTERM sorting domain-containing protein [Natronohydrobacter sp.]|nr:VPEID-CTERM sorting domain-containing protein [Natronohydrobacter sp.]
MWSFWNWFGSGGSSSSPSTTVAVPEIDASTGLLAMAAVGAALLFAWERRRRLASGK